MNMGIVVEGADDSAVYPVLIKRLEPRVERVYTRECFGYGKLKNKFVYLLKEFQKNPAAYNIGKALIICDSDCKDPIPIEQQLQNILDASNLQIDFPVFFHATKCKLESWLLADEDAINDVSVSRGGAGGVQRVAAYLEMVRETDLLYSRALSQAGLQDTDQVMKEIIEHSCLDRLAERCPRFYDFVRKVREP